MDSHPSIKVNLKVRVSSTQVMSFKKTHKNVYFILVSRSISLPQKRKVPLYSECLFFDH